MFVGCKMERLLIVNADDMGLHKDINRGIRVAHTDGIVTSASLVGCGEAFDHALAVLHDCPELDIGIHLTLIQERPLSQPSEISSLVGRDGRFLPSYRQLVTRALAGRLRTAEIRHELEAQVQRVLAAGVRPSHLNSHQHVHVLPQVWKVTQELGRCYSIPFIRLPRFDYLADGARTPWDPVIRLGLNALSLVARYLGHRLLTQIPTTGLHLGGRLSKDDLVGLLARLPPGISELVTHPGFTTPGLEEHYCWGYNWSGELSALTCPLVRSTLQASGVALTRFSQLLH